MNTGSIGNKLIYYNLPAKYYACIQYNRPLIQVDPCENSATMMMMIDDDSIRPVIQSTFSSKQSCT